MAFSRKQELAAFALLAAFQFGVVGHTAYLGYQLGSRCDLQTGKCDVSYTGRLTRMYMRAYLNLAPQVVERYHSLKGGIRPVEYLPENAPPPGVDI